jgi:hypothetical protein
VVIRHRWFITATAIAGLLLPFLGIFLALVTLPHWYSGVTLFLAGMLLISLFGLPPGTMPSKRGFARSLVGFLCGILGLHGIGHFWGKRTKRGLILLFGGWVLIFSQVMAYVNVGMDYSGMSLFLFVGFGLTAIYLCFWVWQTFDAKRERKT